MVQWSDFRVTSGSVLGAALSLAVTTMGAGILTLPSAYADAGVIPASLGLTGVAILTVYSIDFIIVGVDKLGLNSYEELTRELLGRHVENLVRVMLLIVTTGVAVSYLVIVSDLLAPLQPMITSYIPFLTTPKHTLFWVWLVLILPMSCIPKIGALHFTSFLAIAATSLICCMIIFRYFVPGPTPPSAITTEAMGNGTYVEAWWWGSNVLLAMPIIMFSFGCQFIVFQIYAGLSDMCRGTMMKVSIISLIVTGAIHGAVGLFGYLSNPVDVRDNIISNYDPMVDKVFAAGYILYTVPIILAFVLMLFPLRDSIFIMWYGYSSASAATHMSSHHDFALLMEEEERDGLLTKSGGAQSSNPTRPAAGAADHYGSTAATEEGRRARARVKGGNTDETIPLYDHIIVSVLLSTLCVAVAMVTPGIVAVVSFLGGLCGSTLCFVIPGLYRLELHRRGLAPCHGLFERGMMMFMIGFGAVAAVLGTAVSVMNLFSD